ncbi:MAG TPA: LCP family protein [Patescibacteria group bacterium]|nr:LCP family protein [Patescibacteria group bacterium]
MTLKKIGLVLVGIVIVFIAILFVFFRPQISLAKNFTFPDISKISSFEGRTNILILGKAGKDHAGGDLTDTMILVSLSINSPNIAMVSLPRDLWIAQIRAKINSSYHYGGLSLAKSNTELVLGIPVHYGLVLDFSGFKDIVDVLGGISVNVENTFTDNLYPIAGRENDLCDGDILFKCRYESITFTSGLQTMDGATALEFVRSRHAEGTEGTDIAREARQQKIIGAIENKIMDPKVFLNFKKDLAVWKVVMASIETDISSDGGAILARKVFDSMKTINKYLIPDELLVNPKPLALYDKQYVFIPKLGNGKWSDVHKWVNEILK